MICCLRASELHDPIEVKKCELFDEFIHKKLGDSTHFPKKPLPPNDYIPYDIQLPEGEVCEYSANAIAENMYAQVDTSGFVHTILVSILDFSKDDNGVEKEDQYVVTKHGCQRQRCSTAGWKLNILSNDGTEQWIPLAIMKASHAVECAEFAVFCKIQDEPAFAWWVPYALRKRDRLISSANA